MVYIHDCRAATGGLGMYALGIRGGLQYLCDLILSLTLRGKYYYRPYFYRLAP